MNPHLFEFTLNIPTQVRFGVGISKELPKLLKSRCWQRIAVVVDENLREFPSIIALLNIIKQQSEIVVVGYCKSHEPTYESLEAFRGQFEGHSLEVVIGIGGGSAMDTAKGIAVLVYNRKPAIEYRGFDKMTETVLPIICLPTTAGTGSEVTPNASFVASKERKKMGINGEAVRPQYAFLDPELTVSCPRRVTISSAIDSLVHATEAFVAKKTNLLAKFFAKQGFWLVVNHVEDVVKNPRDIYARAQVMLGAFFSGVALMHSGTGPAAAMSYPLGVHYKVPHGYAGAVFLPSVIKYNITEGFEGYKELFCDYTFAKDLAPNIHSDALLLWNILNDLWKRLEVPFSLKDFDVHPDWKNTFIEETLGLRAALDQNPIPFGRESMSAIFEALMI